MATYHPLPDRELPPTAGRADLLQLATALRDDRLTLLCGEAGAGRSALLVDGLLPMLHRRGGDATISAVRRVPEVIMPFPERRPRDRAALAELVIYLNAWSEPSQAALHDGIDAALRAAGVDPEWHRERLSERLQSLGSRFGTRFLLVLDGFEAALEAPGAASARDDLIDELVHLLNLPVPANLLIALRTDARARLAPLLDRLHAVRAQVFMLEDGRARRIDDTAPLSPGLFALATPHAATPKPKPTQLSQFDSARMPEAANTGAPTRPGDIGPTAAAGPRSRFVAPPASPPARPARPVRQRLPGLTTKRLTALASVALMAVVGGALLFRSALPPNSSRATEPTASAQTIATTLPAVPAAPETAAPPAPTALPAPTAPTVLPAPPPTVLPTAAASPARPSFALRVDADNANARLPRELARALAADGAAELQIVPTPVAMPRPFGTAPGLAIVRYDALQAAARAGTKPDLAVVAPLYTEELQVVVRADSPLAFIHQIEGKRINSGAPQGARALTAQALYRQMFGRPLPATPRGQLDAAPALQRLVAGDGIDAVVLVGAQPAEALAGLPPEQRRRVKLLALAPEQPASRRALQAYLPATLTDASGAATPTLAAMSFLVTTGTPDAETATTLARLATSLCHSLPELQRDGDAKWRQLRAGLQLDTGWPQAGAADAAWRACAGTGLAGASAAAAPSPALSPALSPAPSPRN